jgi:hypothetical protein
MSLTRKQVIQAITLLSLLFFVGSTGFAFIGLFTGAKNQPTQAANKAQSQAEQLKLQETGYLEVLKREPKNQTALQGLVEVRLATNDLKGAIAPLETLIELNPNQPSLKELLEKVKASETVPPSK